ncbi:F-box/FBD/LRR-repeat protein At5g56420-like isoform X1 [Oryza glaberrima]|uniref:F-box/FBD/LRR-repeat protein At5g56420-like isoform X1 n=1 Tax=Oryza glaberrima TaxID=4538 RepID=UPI00224C35BD|nr:F-box/FBD/LRR-repeat protein At5g56420-like isoform X1 [Oryza glaberrima]
MSPRRKTRKMSAASTGRVKIGDLPDDLLRRVVSLLSARQAVQTSALSRRWRHLWRSAPLLQILPDDGFRTVRGLNEFAKHLLLLRDRAALLDACVINFDCCEFESYQNLPDDPDVGLWLRHAVSCQAQWIRVEIYVEDDPLCLPDLPLVSKHLRVLELKYVKIKDSLVDFSGCPALEHLKFLGGFIHAHMISSPSVKHMIIDGCGFNRKFRTRISIPSLISLQLKHFWGATPFLEDMPLLVTASVSLSDDCRDRCVNTEFGKCGDPGCFDCGANKVIDCDGCVLLQGLSGTSTLELKAESRVFMFRRDLRWCPMFSKLKTLLINEWFMNSNMSELACLLEHAPLVEKITLQLSTDPYNFGEIEDSDKPLKQAFPFKNLKIVEIKCHEGDERVNTVLKILSQNSVPLEKINVLQTKRRPR